MKYLIVGLGNVGDAYMRSRHNVGFIVLDALYGESVWSKNTTCNALFYEDGESVYIKPLTMMNLSGESVSCAQKRYESDVDHIVVIHDDLDLALGEIRISKGSGDGGHNGIKSIIEKIGEKDFIRIRIGISPMTLFGNKKKPRNTSSYVLQNFSDTHLQKILSLKDDIREILSLISKGDLQKAMNRFN